MFFTHRATQAEYFDLPDRPASELTEFHAALARLNRFFAFAHPFQRTIPQVLGEDACRSLRILDLGAGEGSLGRELREWAGAEHGWDWRFTNLDFNFQALRQAPLGGAVAGSVLALPFGDRSFDVVIASQMTHHLVSDEEVERHLSEAWRVARRAIVLSDLHRGLLLYGVLWVFLHVFRYPGHFSADALLSVRRGFRVNELRRLAQKAGITAACVELNYRMRISLHAWRG